MSVVRIVILLSGVLAVAGCDEKLTGPTAPLNQQFTLAPGETTVIADTDLSVRFNRITGDNRCPADAVCVLGGSADVNITAASDGSRRDHVLRTGDMQPVQHDEFTISLIQVAPYPFSARPIDPAEYRVTLSVSR
jgi:hypothetical protein